MTTFTSEDRKNAYDTPTVIVDSGASASPTQTFEVDHLREFIHFGKTNFAQGALLFGAEFLEDALAIAEELLRTKLQK